MKPLVKRAPNGRKVAVPSTPPQSANGQAPQPVVPPPRRRNGVRKRGEPLAKLTENDVRKARALYKDGWTISALAYGFDVTTSTMCSIVHRQTWKHVEDTEPTPTQQDRQER